MNIFLYAHRGVSAHAPENTLAAFSKALESCADGVELDVHLSADNIPVVIHDQTLQRTTNGVGRVDDFTAAELMTLDAGRWFAPEFAGESLPTLRQALGLLSGHLRINVEIKDSAAALAALNVIREFPAAEVIVSSFDLGALASLRRADARLPLAVLCDSTRWQRLLSDAVALNSSAVHMRADLVTRPLIAAASSAGLPVYAWTVDDPARARSLVRARVVGVFTNDPGLLRTVCPAVTAHSS